MKKQKVNDQEQMNEQMNEEIEHEKFIESIKKRTEELKKFNDKQKIENENYVIRLNKLKEECEELKKEFVSSRDEIIDKLVEVRNEINILTDQIQDSNLKELLKQKIKEEREYVHSYDDLKNSVILKLTNSQ